MTRAYYGNSSRKRTDIAVISTDVEGRVTVFNQSAERLLGYFPEEIIGQGAPIRNFDQVCAQVGDAQALPLTEEFIHKNGDLIGMEVILSPIRNNEGRTTGFLLTASRHDESAQLKSPNDLPNRSTFDIILDREIRRTQREGQEIAVLKIDVDHYKDYLKQYGEAETNACLTQIAQAFDQRIQRAGDFLAFGSHDEFLVILPNTDKPGTVKVAEQLRLMVQQLDMRHEKSNQASHVSVSIGIAHLAASRDTTPEQVMAIADNALKQAKQEGRNCSRLGE